MISYPQCDEAPAEDEEEEEEEEAAVPSVPFSMALLSIASTSSSSFHRKISSLIFGLWNHS